MGEKQGKGGDGKDKPAAKPEGDGGEKKKQQQQDGGKGDGDGKKKDGPLTVVLKVDMHCDGCAKKIKRSVCGFDGVESVSVDAGSGKLTAVGKIDPWKLRDHVEAKTHKKVVLVSPTDAPKKKDEPKKDGDGKEKGGAGDKKDQDKAPKEVTVMLKMRLHCEGCIKRIRRTILRFQGVENVSVEAAKDLVTVKGTMDVKAMVVCLEDKLKRGVEIVQPKKDDGGGGKGGGGGGGGGKGGDGEKKKDGGGGGGEEKAKAAAAVAAAAAEANKLEYLFGGGGYGGGPAGLMYAVPPNLGGHAGYQFLQQQHLQGVGGMGFPFGQPQVYPQAVAAAVHHMPHPPQIFSDENPNACSIM